MMDSTSTLLAQAAKARRLAWAILDREAAEALLALAKEYEAQLALLPTTAFVAAPPTLETSDRQELGGRERPSESSAKTPANLHEGWGRERAESDATLERLRRHVSNGQRHVARQQELVRQLHQAGGPSARLAEQLLTTFEETLAYQAWNLARLQLEVELLFPAPSRRRPMLLP
jgi:hypothetical protein